LKEILRNRKKITSPNKFPEQSPSYFNLSQMSDAGATFNATAIEYIRNLMMKCESENPNLDMK